MASSAALMQAAPVGRLSVGIGAVQAGYGGRAPSAAMRTAPLLSLNTSSEAQHQPRAFANERTWPSAVKSSKTSGFVIESRGLLARSSSKHTRERAGAKSAFLGATSAFVEDGAFSRRSSPTSGRGGALTAEANLFARIYRIFVSSVSGAVKSQEDPSKLLDQAVIDMQEDLGKVKQATAAVVGAQRQLEQKYTGASQVSRMWYDRARLALSKGEEDLARRALEMRKIEEDKATSFKDQLDKQTMISTKLVANTKLLENKMKEAQSKKDSLKYRAEAAKATQAIQEMLGSIDTSKAIFAFEKLEEDVLRAEAKADALSDLVTSDMDAKFAALESDSAVEDDLQQLKDSMRSTRALPPPKASETEGRSVFWKEYVDPRVERELAELRGQVGV